MSEIDPNKSDLVLGGQNSPPLNAAVLGGLAGVASIKQRLASELNSDRIFGRKSKVYSSKIDVRTPEDITYIVKVKYASKFENEKTRIHIDSLLADKNISRLKSLIIELDLLLVYQWERNENFIVELMQPILLGKITPALESLGIDYKGGCSEFSERSGFEAYESARKTAINGMLELVSNSLVARQSLKHLNVRIPAGQIREYG